MDDLYSIPKKKKRPFGSASDYAANKNLVEKNRYDNGETEVNETVVNRPGFKLNKITVSKKKPFQPKAKAKPYPKSGYSKSGPPDTKW